ncbi:MAG: hypothetical protein V3S24_09550, partial [Candidatus Tectomicrobia bacterium]
GRMKGLCMMLHEGSLLRHLPVGLHLTHAKFLDAIRLSIDCVALAYSRLVATPNGMHAVPTNANFLKVKPPSDADVAEVVQHISRWVIRTLPGHAAATMRNR